MTAASAVKGYSKVVHEYTQAYLLNGRRVSPSESLAFTSGVRPPFSYPSVRKPLSFLFIDSFSTLRARPYCRILRLIIREATQRIGVQFDPIIT